jgi:hypothetical protein
MTPDDRGKHLAYDSESRGQGDPPSEHMDWSTTATLPAISADPETSAYDILPFGEVPGGDGLRQAERSFCPASCAASCLGGLMSNRKPGIKSAPPALTALPLVALSQSPGLIDPPEQATRLEARIQAHTPVL